MAENGADSSQKITIGLFGTCGGSKWRDPFMSEYKRLGINYFNPQIENWHESCADIEAQHLADDQIILFPVTSETYAAGSLAEVGFSILNAISLDDRRYFVILIVMELDSRLDNEVARKESLRSRALVKQHLKKLRLSNLYLVDSLEEMLAISLKLHEAVSLTEPLKRYNPHNRIKL